jgi:sec-independent protein translocase protein TatA
MEFFSPGHLIVIAIVAAVLFFGWKQLPDMARSLGRSLRVFKTEIKGMSEDDKAREAATNEPAALEAPPAATPVAPQPAAAPTTPPPAPRPRPAPTPNGRAEAPAKTD